MLEALKRIGRTPRKIILRLEEVPFLDASGAIALQDFLRQAQGNGIEAILCGLRPDLRDLLGRLSRDSGALPTLASDYAHALRLAAD